MQRDLCWKIIAVVFTAAVSLSGAFAQQTEDKCAQLRYSEHLTNPYRYRLRGIKGQVVYGAVAERGELTGASGVCIGLFNPNDKRLVATATTRERRRPTGRRTPRPTARRRAPGSPCARLQAPRTCARERWCGSRCAGRREATGPRCGNRLRSDP